MESAELKDLIRTRYGAIASEAGASACCDPVAQACCSPATESCCGTRPAADSASLGMGYSEAELADVPEGANLGLGCGNPQAVAAMRPGEADHHRPFDELAGCMLQHPLLINRPIVVTPLDVKLCWGSETVLNILPSPHRGAFAKEDGEPVVDAQERRMAARK